MMKRIIIILLGLSVTFSVWAQKERKYIREGNREYKNKQYSKADVQYRKALDKNNNSFEAKFNIGDALYKQGKYQEAAQQFQTITGLSHDKKDLAKIYHNIGNAYLQAHQQVAQADTNGFLQKSIDAYKMALKNNSEDMDTKYNLSYALKLLKKQQQQQKNKKNNQNKNDKKKQQKKQNQDKKKQNKDKKNQNKKKQDQQKQQQQKQKQQKKQQQQGQQQKQKMSKQDAARLLKALQQNENKLQDKLKKQKSKKVKVEKDW